MKSGSQSIAFPAAESLNQPGSAAGRSLRLAYFSPETFGGLADYAREQSHALGAAGASVSFVTAPSIANRLHDSPNKTVPILAEIPASSAAQNRWARRLRSLRWILGNMRSFADWIERERVRYVLFGSFMEYLAPLWVAPYRQLAAQGVVFGSVIHDPIRNTPLGPQWWQRRSIAANYSFLAEAFVHDPIELDTVRPMAQLQTTVIPHGPYPFTPPRMAGEMLRQQLQIPANAVLLLAFGLLRDAKNLDLVLRAMKSQPDTYLLVAGKELSATQKPAAYYQKLAAQLGLADRCRWRIGFVPEAEIGNYFAAADLVLLTYNHDFRSASGVLNVATQFRRPCLASGGAGNLKTSVIKYGLGQWIEPDDVSAIANGLARWRAAARPPDWAGYARDNSWERNATLVLQRFSAHPTLISSAHSPDYQAESRS
jgi:glycosyltransferase involved in cell wall biosynthesis